MRYKDIAGPSSAGKPIEKTERLEEGRKYIDVSNHETLGVDQPHHKDQQVHAHLENGRAVNKDGSISHGGEPFYLTRAQADALRRIDFEISKTRLIENEGENAGITIEVEPEIIAFLIQLQKLSDRFDW